MNVTYLSSWLLNPFDSDAVDGMTGFKFSFNNNSKSINKIVES